MKLFVKQNAAYAIFLLFILFAPLFNGLFNKGALYGSLILLLLITIIFIAKVQTLYIDVKLFALFALQFVFCGISAINGINREEAIFGFFKFMFIPVVFVLSLNSDNLKIGSRSRDEWSRSPIKSYNLLMLLIFTTGTVISIINISLSFMKTTNLKNYRADAVFGYANTLALFVFICSVIGFYFYYSGDRPRLFRVALKLGIFFNITVLILTYSRTMWILSLFLYTFFLLYIRKPGSAADSVLLIFASSFSGITISSGMWLISVPVFLALSLILIYYEYSLRTRFVSLIACNKFRRSKALAIAVFAAIILFLAFSVSLIGSTYLNQRIAAISFGATELQERFAYYNDAASIVKDYPLFGTGSGGWSSIQFKYQTALYSVKYVHSAIFQTVLDYGLAGLLLFISQIIVLISYAIRIFRNNCGKKLKYALALAVVCNSAILLHSAIDFDFEFSTTVMIFWINMAFLSRASGNVRSISFHKGDWKHKESQKIALTIRIGLSSVIALVILCLLSLYISDFFYSKGISLYNSRNYVKAEASLENAFRFNPFSSNSYYARSKSLSSQLKNRYSGKLKECIEYLLTAEKYDPFKPAYAESLADIYDNLNDYRKSAEQYGKLTKLSPMKIYYYEGLSQSLMAMAETDFRSGRADAAENKCKKIVRIPEQLEKARTRISANAGKLKHKLVLKITPELAYNIGRAYLYLNDNRKAIEYLKIASKGKSIPKSWLLKQYTL